jgi:hypothetical protein
MGDQIALDWTSCTQHVFGVGYRSGGQARVHCPYGMS